jgi:hypothetical protein
LEEGSELETAAWLPKEKPKSREETKEKNIWSVVSTGSDRGYGINQCNSQ